MHKGHPGNFFLPEVQIESSNDMSFVINEEDILHAFSYQRPLKVVSPHFRGDKSHKFIEFFWPTHNSAHYTTGARGYSFTSKVVL